jgi:hypothetical protein
VSLLLALSAAKGLKNVLRKKNTAQAQTPADSIKTVRKIGPGGIISSKSTTVYPSKAGGGTQGLACAPFSHDGRFRATRPNKSTYVTRGGGTSRWPHQLVLHEKGSECVTVRRRHVTNAKALRRAISRLKGFVKTYRKAASLLGHHRRSARCGTCRSNPCRCK